MVTFFYHGAGVRNTAMKFLVHFVDCLCWWRIVRQIIVNVVINANELLQKQTNDSENRKSNDNRFPMIHHKIIDFVHKLPS